VPDTGPGLTATGVRIVDTLDTRLSAGAVTTVGRACSVNGITITCDLDPLAPGESATVEIPVKVPDSIEPGMVLANHIGYLVDQENQASVQENGDVLTVVAPADFVVNTLADHEDANPGDGLCAADSGTCSLRAAVQEANSGPPGRRTIALAGWQVVLGEELFVAGDVEIIGLGVGRTIIGGSGGSRLFNVSAGGSLSLNSLTLEGGSSNESGGAIFNAGTARLVTVQVSGNDAAYAGGAIYNTGTLTLTDSAVTGNRADQGAGAVDNRATLHLENVTVSGNRGINGGIVSTGDASMENVTLTHNHGAGAGGLLVTPGSTASLRNTILTGNISDEAAADCWGDLTSLGYNLLGEGCAASAGSTDITGQPPRLGFLERAANNTMIHPLLVDSPAIDAGDCRLAADQLGNLRPVDGDLDGISACDIGALEFQPYRIWLPVLLR
jgi:CSLREA domain-containing protein